MSVGSSFISSDYGQTELPSGNLNYSLSLYDFNEALTPYGTIETRSPSKTTIVTDDFREGTHFRTGTSVENYLQLELEDRILTIIVDESGSMTWNDNTGIRYEYLKRLLSKLDATYPGSIKSNLIGFGGIATTTNLFVADAGGDLLGQQQKSFSNFLQETFQDSVFDFAGVRIVRRSDRYPTHPADGVVVDEGILNAAKDEDLVEGQRYYYGIWTFNKNLHFSRGQFISAIPYDRILPRGVNFASALPRLLPGVERDSNTVLIYNFAEGSGRSIFDSSGEGYHGTVNTETIEENFWLGDSASFSHEGGGEGLRRPVGVRFDGEFDIIETDISNTTNFNITSSNSLTVNLWIYRYAILQDTWIIGTSTNTPSTSVGWAIGLNSDGGVSVVIGDVSTGLPDIGISEVIPEKQWTMVTVLLSVSGSNVIISVYVNAVLVITTSVTNNSSSADTLYIGAKPVDSGSTWPGTDFFGSIAHLSVHSTTRNQSYISDTYVVESSIFDQSLSDFNQNPPDNRQREVLLSWEIGDDFDYQNGSVRIVRKYRDMPDHDNDGTIILNRTAEEGQFFFIDSYDFTNNSDYFYRIFTYNSIGNVCAYLDARLLSVHIPQSNNEGDTITLSPVSGETVTHGDRKILLEWTNPNDSDWRGTKVFFGENAFPTVDDDNNTDEFEITDTINGHFVHRTDGKSQSGTDILLTNGAQYFYTIVTYDRLGHLSEPRYLIGNPSSQFSTVFLPEEVKDLHIELVNPKTLSIQWDNPIVRTEEIELFFGELAMVFVNVRDIFGGALTDISNLKLQVCTTITERNIETNERSVEEEDRGSNRWGGGHLGINGRRRSARFTDDCNTEQEEEETILSYATVESGLIKGLLTHINDRIILSRRKKYVMNVRAQYQVKDVDVNSTQSLFEFNTLHSTVTFKHPIAISAINKLNKFVVLRENDTGKLRGEPACECPDNDIAPPGSPEPVNGGYINATIPYICRVEIQYKKEALPEGTPVNVSLFKAGSVNNPHPLSESSDRTSIREGIYNTSSVLEEEVLGDGSSTGRLISKSIIDIEIMHPSLPDHVDIYITLDFSGFFIDVVHTVRFIGSLFLTANIDNPPADGIATSEQFATLYTIHPDFPDDLDKRLPVPDGTLVKWELIKLDFGKERPFYSTEILSDLLAGVYSTTVNGVARKVFFGPVGNVENHDQNLNCADQGIFNCCVGEEYAIRASAILGEESASDGKIFNYPCITKEFSGLRFFMNAVSPIKQVFTNINQNPPHWITWADGEHMIKISIARDSDDVLDTEIQGSSCFRNCLSVIGGRSVPLSDGKIVQIMSQGEILWNVSFDIDPYTGKQTPVSYNSRPADPDNRTILPANIPINGRITDFYIRWNRFIDQSNPRPVDPEEDGNGTWAWRNICTNVGFCYPTTGPEWVNVFEVSGSTTVIANNIEATLISGGGYSDGMPPIYVGFQEPLKMIVDFPRANGVREIQELVMDGVSYHTFVIEVLFAGEPVPDGTPVEVSVEGEGQEFVILSDCIQNQSEPQVAYCTPSSTGVIYTQQINDIFINPQNDSGTIPKKSFAMFTINPLYDTVSFSATIKLVCRYDKLTSLGQDNIQREITHLIEIHNSIDVISPEIPEDDRPSPDPRSNEAIVYDTVQDLYETTRAGLLQRIGHFMSAVTHGTIDSIYVFGGMASNGVTAISEVYDTNTQTWDFTTDMVNPRAFGMTVESEGIIYCIGGIEQDALDSLVVSSRIDAFDTISETWNPTLSPMRETTTDVFGTTNTTVYPIAYGDAQVIGDYIYVTCGVTSMISETQPGDLNENILRYSISADEWKSLTPSNIDLYKRLTPFGFYRSNPIIPGGNESEKQYYIYGGSIPKSIDEIENERAEKIQSLLEDLWASILVSSYYLNLTETEQSAFLESEERRIRDGVVIPAFVYISTGFRFMPGSESIEYNGSTMNISDSLDQYWPIMPKARDHGKCVYIPHQDIVYFMGGSNQNHSTTLNRVESIDLSNDNLYTKLTSFNRGRAMFGADYVNDDIFFSGGLTSGHREGWVQIDVQQFPDKIEARGTQSCGLLITLTNDSGEIIEENARVDVRGIIRIDAINEIMTNFLANRGADRALGGDGSGNAADLPGYEEIGEDIDIDKLIRAQNKLIDPNSDEFQFNASRKLGERVFLFPILYSQNEFVINNGIGGVTLEARSEDPLTNFTELAKFIDAKIANTPEETEKFEGDLTREELAALGDALATIETPATIIDSGALRELYKVETLVTILDNNLFGQTVSDFDLNIQERIRSRIIELLTPEPEDPATGGGSTGGGSTGGNGTLSDPSILADGNGILSDNPSIPTGGSGNDTNPLNSGDLAQSGQCEWCSTILPRHTSEKPQKPTVETLFYNVVDWMPQIKKRIIDNTTSLSDIIDELDIIDHEVPFGGSQLYNAILESSRVTGGDDLDQWKKVIYIASDNSQNLSLLSRYDAIEAVNSIDGDRKVPVVYTMFSTSFPMSLAAELQRSDVGDVDKISQDTGGQSATLISPAFLDQILNSTIGGATGGLGYGIYLRLLEFSELSSVTAMTLDFLLPSNTQGYVRLRYSQDGFNFNDFSERYEGSQVVDFVDFFAKSIEIEVVLTTGFTSDITEEYDNISTGIPQLQSITWDTSGDRTDYMYLNTEDVLTNAQQVAASFEGDLPSNAIVNIGVATSGSHDWRDFWSPARPPLLESGKTFLLDRDDDPFSLVPREPLISIDGLRYVSNYGSWDPESQVELFEVRIVTSSGGSGPRISTDIITTEEVPVLSGFVLYPRQGEIYFDTKQDPSKIFSMTIINQNKIRVGVKLSNRLHTDSIFIHGVGFIYSTNDAKPVELSQVAPRALNVRISPTNPTSNDTIFALYDYLDLNNETEQGTIISWFKNGSQLLEIQNQSSWVNDDLLLENRLEPNDKIMFSVSPSDGKDLGTTVFSPTVDIMPTKPGASDVRITPFVNNIINSRHDTSSSLVVQYAFNTDDEGAGAIEHGTTINWFVNGVLFKGGTWSDAIPDPENTAKTIAPGEVGNGIIAHVINNEIYVEVTPKTSTITGETIRSSTIVINNTVPIITNLQISPAIPNTQSTLTLSYTVSDLDIANEVPGQSDQSEIKWFNSPNGINFAEITGLSGNLNVAPSYLKLGESWYATVTPFDGLELGESKTSVTVVVQS